MRRLALALALLAALAVPASAGAQDADTAAANGKPTHLKPLATRLDPTFRPTLSRTYVARLIMRTGVYVRAGARNAARAMSPWIASTGNPVVLQVIARRVDSRGDGWLKVLMPERPNGSTAWIREESALVSKEPMRIRISLSRHLLTVYRHGRPIRRVGVALGAPETPTPRGHFAIYQKVREPSPSPLGPWALHLTAHSNVLFEYDGGPGRVAIHGARGALWAAAGTNPSHGCIRVPDPKIRLVAPLVHAGTPVDIVA